MLLRGAEGVGPVGAHAGEDEKAGGCEEDGVGEQVGQVGVSLGGRGEGG